MNFFVPATRPWALRLALFTVLAGSATNSAFADNMPPAEQHANSSLTTDDFYGILLGELHVRKGDFPNGFGLLLNAARQSNDVQLYSRAVDVALQAHSGDGALVAARAWVKAWPQDRKANTRLLQVLLALNQVGESLEPLSKALATTPEFEREAFIQQIPALYARVSDKKKASDVVGKALSPYLSQSKSLAAQAWATLGQLRLAEGNTAGALEAAQKGHASDAKAQGPMLLALALMEGQVPEAQALVDKGLPHSPDPEMKLRHARVLIGLNRYTQASDVLQSITRSAPALTDAWLILGLLQFEQSQAAQSEVSLSRYVELESKKLNAQNVQGLTQAQTRRASLKARDGKLEEARQLLAQLPASTAQEERSRLMAQVQLLREQRQWKMAFDLLAPHSEGDSDLMYEQAMLAEKIEDIATMERLLKAVITQSPDSPNAYNALGFSWADRGVKLNEAKALIEKALALSSNDPFILDSLAWVEFRLGHVDIALKHLEKAFAARPDAEIAAHWGEVLWLSQRKQEAIAIWRKGLTLSPTNETLQETLRRFKPAL